jgi:glycosyltransferase involved in cell wall biosynthesis
LKNTLTFILISNYPPDKQESMRRYAESLQLGLQAEGFKASIWFPKVFFAYFSNSTNAGIGKWLGYLDKWIVYSLVLKIKSLLPAYRKSTVFFHICDHSNAPYLAVLPKDRSGITCHDVLAIRGAMGFEDAYCPASTTGKILQKWILNNLIKAKRLVAVSQFTLNQLQDLAGVHTNWKVVHNAFNAEFYPMAKAEQLNKLAKLGIKPEQKFILHIGSSLPRKNRKLLVKMLSAIGDKWDGYICFAGQKVSDKLCKIIEKHGLQDRVISVVKPSHIELLALYSACEAFVFPSYSEGFGWPVIEAQACGAPVIASDIAPMKEVCGSGAILINPDNENEFAQALITLQDPTIRAQWIQLGFENCKRFETTYLMQNFAKIYID